jgi:hypothetical protein
MKVTGPGGIGSSSGARPARGADGEGFRIITPGPAGDLDRLRRAIRDERDATEDPGLEAVLDEIELRAAVEMAKLERSARAA